MDANFSNQNKVEQPIPPSQTGSPQQPIQVENVQYNVKVGKFFSRVALAFIVACTSLIFLVLALALVLYGVAGQMFGFEEDVVTKRVILLIALSVPLLPLHIFSANRLNKLIKNPANLEDITFKKYLRNMLWGEIIVGALFITIGIYNGLSIIFLNSSGSVAEEFSSVAFFGGAFVFLALWSYSFQKLTQR